MARTNRRRKSAQTMSALMFQSTPVFMTAFFFLLLGISAGVFTELMMGSAFKTELFTYLEANLIPDSLGGNTLPDIFLSSISNNLLLIMIIFTAGLTLIGFPAAYACIAYKGVSLGFSAALVLEAMGGSGAVIMCTLIPQNLIFLPVLILAVSASANLSLTVLKNKKEGIKKCLSERIGIYTLLHLILAFFIMIGSLAEAFICPLLLKLIG